MPLLSSDSFVFSLLPYLGILGTLSLDQWEIRPQPSVSSAHDWNFVTTIPGTI